MAVPGNFLKAPGKARRIVDFYHGNEVQDHLTRLLSSPPAGLSESKRVLGVAVEAFQNAKFHAPHGAPAPSLAIARQGSHWVVMTGNAIAVNQTKKLRQTLLKLNAMNDDELKREWLNNLSSGLGVGLVEIFRKSRQSIAFSFRTMTSQLDYFNLEVTIPSTELFCHGGQSSEVYN